MSLGQPVNWGAPIQSPAAQPEYFRYQGDGYVRMGDGKILSLDNHLRQQSALQRQAWVDAANRYDPSAPTQMAARAMEAQPYKSPTTNQPISREQFFNEHRQLDTQARSRAAAAYQQRLATAGSAWDTPLPRGVTVDMIPTGRGTFAPAPSGGALAPLRSTADQRAGFTPLPRSAAVIGEALRQPINLGVKPPGQPLLAKPGALASAGQGALYGGGAAAGAWMGGAGFWEGAGAGLGGALGGIGGGLAGAAAGGAAGGALGTIPAPIVGTVSGAAVGGYLGGGIGAGIGGGIGSSLGSGLGRLIDNLIPDFFGPEYPNALDPNAMEAGAIVEPGTPPPFTGGQSPGVLYVISYSVNGDQVTGVLPSQLTYGPITGLTRQTVPGPGPQGQPYAVTYPGTASGSQIFLNLQGLTGRWVDPSRNQTEPVVTNLTITRADGRPDTGGNPPGGIDPVRAPNPARQPSPGAPARTLPPSVPQPTATETPWPGIAPQSTPDTTPLAPPAPAPVPNFSSTPTPDPLPPTTPDATPTDLESPSETPSNLADNPLTPPATDPLTPVNPTAPAGGRSPILGGLPGTFSGSSTSPLAVAIPVVLIDGLRQKVNTPTGSLTNRTQPNPNIQVVKPPPAPTVNLPQPPTCIYERQRVMDIQNKATDTQQRAANPVSGFPGLYGLQIESRLKLGQTFELLGTVNTFMRKAWEATRMQKVLDVLTFVGVMHNVSMLSRNVGETFLEVVGQGIQAVGIRDEENNIIDVNEVVSSNVEGLLKNVLGVERYNGINEAWNKANRIISSASAVIWTVRSIADASQDLMEWIGENTGKIGNALKRYGVVGERAYPWMSENAKAQHRMRTRFSKLTGALETTEDRISVYGQATSGVIELTEETNELAENFGRFKDSVVDGVPDPWLDNNPIQTVFNDNKAASEAPDLNPANTQKG